MDLIQFARGDGEAIPLGLCQCGCGQRTRIAEWGNTARGWVKGQPVLYVSGHNSRKTFTPEELAERAERRRQRDIARNPKRAAQAREKRALDPEAARATEREKYARNRSKWLALQSEWRRLNPDRVRAQTARRYARRKANGYYQQPEVQAGRTAYYLRKREEHAARNRAWKKSNREVVLFHDRARRARKKGAEGGVSKDIVRLLMTLQRGKCTNCRTNLRRTGHHLDHIQPLCRGGAHRDENVQLLCPTCNLKKGARDPVHWAQSQGRLL